MEKRAAGDDEKYLEPAAKCGLSITRYKRKLERGEIVFGKDGSVTAISKKDIKKMKKRGEDPAKLVAEANGKKRKRSEEDLGGARIDEIGEEKKEVEGLNGLTRLVWAMFGWTSRRLACLSIGVRRSLRTA